ncbi:MAG: helix-turn-helix domain-containing protein [Patescibacteria group bacterium]
MSPYRDRSLASLRARIRQLERDLAYWKDLAERKIPPTARPAQCKRPTVKQIETIVAGVCGIEDVTEFYGKRRTQPLAFARQLIMHFLSAYKFGPLRQIGEMLGGRKHGAVLEANKVVTACANQNCVQRDWYNACCDQLDALCSPVPRVNIPSGH